MPSADPSPSDASPELTELTEVDLLMRLARRWRRLGAEEAGHGIGLSPHQERALLALARLSRRAPSHGGTPEDGSAEHPRRGGGSAEHPRPADGSAEHPPASGVRVSHLAAHLGIAPRSATEVADALEAAGLLTRTPDPSDRRAVLLRLTEHGLHTVSQARDRRRAAAQAAVSTLSPADRAELRRLLQTLLDA